MEALIPRRLRRTSSALVVLGFLGWGCRSGPLTAVWRRPPFEGDAQARPRLDEIFADPPLFGRPPRPQTISPDGRFLLVRWDPPDAAPNGRDTLRLIEVDAPETHRRAGVPIADLLPPLDPAPKADAPRVGPFAWAPEGHLLACVRGGDVFLLDPARGTAEPLLSAPLHPSEDEAPPAEAPGGTRAWIGSVRALAFSRDGTRLHLMDDRELYAFDLARETPGGEPAPLEAARWVSRDLDAPARRLSWSDDLELALGHDPPPRTPPPVASGGAPEAPREVWFPREGRGVLLEGMADERWLERISLSPDGRFACAVAFDRAAEPEKHRIPDYLTERVSVREARNLRADDPPSPFELWVWDTRNGTRRRVLPAGGPVTRPPVSDEARSGRPPAPWRIRTIGWAPQASPEAPARFAFELYSADFRLLEVWCWTEGYCEKLWEERDPAWVGGPARWTGWTGDGRYLILGSESRESSRPSTTPGHAQLFRLDPETLSARQLTTVEGEVHSFVTLKGGGLVAEASREDPARESVLFLDAQALAEGRPPVWLPTPPGSVRGLVGSNDARRVVFAHERLFQPAELWAATAERAWPLSDTQPARFRSVRWIRPRRLTVEAPDGREIRAHVFLPPGLRLDGSGAHHPRAGIAFVHGAGYLQNVTDSMTRYPRNLLFHSRLARLGYVVFDVDYRGSAGYGRDFRTDVQGYLGGKDLDDIHRVLDELVERGLVDPQRVGIYGGSYGGFLTLMALFTAPDRWSAGAALRSVTDWRTYNPWYTQPRLGRPSTAPEAYARSSPIDHVDGLQDPLLVLHGLVDSNVFAQDSIRLIEALIDRGKDFEAMLYPSQGHAFEDAAHWLDEYRRIERFLVENVGPP